MYKFKDQNELKAFTDFCNEAPPTKLDLKPLDREFYTTQGLDCFTPCELDKMHLVKSKFDIQRVHTNGSSLSYQLYYMQAGSYKPVNKLQFNDMQAARAFRDKLLDT